MSDEYAPNLDDYLVSEESDQVAQNLPYSADAERAVLACVMKNDAAWDLLTGLIDSTDFYEPRNIKIFEAMETLARQGSPLTQVTVSEALRNADKLQEVGGYPYFLEINETMHDPRMVETYAEMVSGSALRRNLIGVADYIKRISYVPGDLRAEDVLSESEASVLALSKDKTGEKHQHSLVEVLGPMVAKIEKLREAGGKLAGLRSGFWDLDDITGGFHSNDLIVIAARPSMGKTSFALNICEHLMLGKDSQPVLFFSLETGHSQIVMRMLVTQSCVDYKTLESAELSSQQLRQLRSATAMLTDKPFYVVDKPSLSIDEMRSYARRVNRELKTRHQTDKDGETERLALIVVDYLQLIRPSRRYDSRVPEVGEISRGLKALAKEFEVPVIALAQLNRKPEERNDKRPRMSDLRESGAIEQDADLIITIHREDFYEDVPLEDSQKPRVAEINVAKHRNGPTGQVKLNWVKELMKFEGSEGSFAKETAQSRPSDPPSTAESSSDEDQPPF